MKKSKIMLISVLMEKNAIITEEIGICSIAAYLEEKGCDVRVINSSRNHMDFNEIYDYAPDLIGFPVYSTTEKIVHQVCQDIRKRLPDVKIAYGGYWPTLNYEDLMNKYPDVDFMIRGEGEVAFYNLVKAITTNGDLRSVKSLVYRDGDQIIVNEREELIKDLDTLPMPKRDLLKSNLLKYAYISTSRGCLGSCSFCWHQKFWNSDACTQWRGRSPENVIKEIKMIVDEYGVDRFWFIDDSFEDYDKKDPNRMWNIAQKIIDAKLDISYETYMRSEIYKKMDDQKMKTLVDSGFVGVIFGTESGNEEDLKLYHKIASAEDNLKSIEFFRKYGIAVDIGFINFNPYSTFERLHKNVDFLEETVFASVLYYLVERCGITKFSKIYDRVNADGLLLQSTDTGCYSYRYTHEDIGKLSDFLYYRYHENEGSKEYFYAKKIGSYIREELKLLNHIKRKYRYNCSIVTSIQNSEERAWELLRVANRRNAAWFRELLYMTEKHWDEDKAEKISEKYISLAEMKALSDQLEKNRLALYVKLKQLGVAPDKYFNFL